MYGFNFLVKVLSGIHGIYDTQCGFKLFSRRVARCVFPSLHLERWAFDIEILYVASRLGFVIEVGSKRRIYYVGSACEVGRDRGKQSQHHPSFSHHVPRHGRNTTCLLAINLGAAKAGFTKARLRFLCLFEQILRIKPAC